jgi:CHAD domain
VDQGISEAVHDFRKTTRDLQILIDACTVRKTSRRAVKIRRRLQRCRHALSEWRDSDVMLSELKKAGHDGHSTAQRQWWQKLSKNRERRAQARCAAPPRESVRDTNYDDRGNDFLNVSAILERMPFTFHCR